MITCTKIIHELQKQLRCVSNRGILVKRLLKLLFLLGFILLSACSGQENGELTRVDIKKVNDVEMITDDETIERIEAIFNQIKWEDKVVNMERKPDVEATLFYTFDENMPERLVEYKVWLNESTDTTTIVRNKQTQAYGELDEENTNSLKRILFK